jgi:hypothetical protein
MAAMESLDGVLRYVSFRDAVIAFPIAIAAHVVEEWPRFPRWARRFASSDYSDREYALTHWIAISAAALVALALRWFPAGWLVFAFFAFVFGPGVFCNAVFHAGASLVTRTYCPGTGTGLVLYLPLGATVAALATGEGLISRQALVFALVIAAAFHTWEVGHNVFKRW